LHGAVFWVLMVPLHELLAKVIGPEVTYYLTNPSLIKVDIRRLGIPDWL